MENYNSFDNSAFQFSERLDQEFLQSIYDDDVSFAQEVFSGFLSETQNELELIENHFNNADLGSLRKALHKVKPTFSLVGLTKITEDIEFLIVKCDSSASVQQVEQPYNDILQSIRQSLPLVREELNRMESHNQ